MNITYKSIKIRARAIARRLGHVMQPKWVENENSYSCSCVNCGMTLSVHVNSARNYSSLEGQAYYKSCSNPS